MSGDASKYLQRLTDDQGQGASPDGHAWMSASAGTGKTQVLTARVLRLLLAGVEPHAILAITFTRAGASEMARRIRDVLARWVQLPDQDLRKELFAVHLPGHDDPAMLARARTLFAKVIDAPGSGLAIQTIHSFCQSLLASFPEEAGLAPGFRALDEREIAEVRRDVLGDLIDGATRTGNLPFIAQLQALSLAMGEEATTAYLYRCAQAVDALDSLPDGVAPWLRRQFDLPGGDPASWVQAQCADDAIDRAGLHAILEANRAWGTATGEKPSASG
jgi:ATP-dependent helicase/nuclease subunit A